jgi:hypothetical protein
MSNAPLFPLVAEPELIMIAPLMPPVVPPSGVVIEIKPVEVALCPEEIHTNPPVPVLAVVDPALKARVPPLLLFPVPTVK